MLKTDSLYPLLFRLDHFQPYLWGGQKLRSFVTPEYDGQPIAEIWAIADRPEEQIVSTVVNGPLAGKTLHDLLDRCGSDLLGRAQPTNGKFPLLVKLLDAADTLSVQVHPPVAIAAKLGGEPKTECWYFLNGTEAGAEVYAGLRPDVTPEQFRKAVRDGTVAGSLHVLPSKPGKLLAIPAGRLHALGRGSFVLEVQENSNTTYRVFDWNRIDKKTGQPRQLHIEEAMSSINFDDTHAEFEQFPIQSYGSNTKQPLLRSGLFDIEVWTILTSQDHCPQDSFDIIFADRGPIRLTGKEGEPVVIEPLHFCLIPWAAGAYRIEPQRSSAHYVRICMEHQ